MKTYIAPKLYSESVDPTSVMAVEIIGSDVDMPMDDEE